jgi:hypothetical protein
MQTRELDQATIAVANTTDISGTATARLGSVAGLPGLRSLMAAGMFVALPLAPIGVSGSSGSHSVEHGVAFGSDCR